MTNHGPDYTPSGDDSTRENPTTAGHDYDNTAPHYPADYRSQPAPYAGPARPSYAAPGGPGAQGPQGPPPAATPYGLGAQQRPTMPPLPPQQPVRETGARGRRRFAAGVIAAALVVGGGAGLGGAAAWSALHEDAVSGSTGVTNQVRSTSSTIGASSSAATDGTVESVASKVLPSVVKIDVSGSQGAGSGSGIILNSTGQILTNNHVVELASGGGSLSVSFNDGSSTTAKVLGTDPLTDTALIQADNVSGLTPATIGTSSDLNVGQGVVAVGSPFGLESTVTSGIVSALNRPVDVGSDGAGNSTVYQAIQTDAAINPGNSGGALTDMAGNVVGINASIRTAGTSGGEEAGSIGLGFAIPMDEVIPIVEQMAAGQTPTHARLGVTVADVGAQAGAAAGGQSGAGQTGALVSEGAAIQTVGDGSTAAAAGIQKSDVITKINDQIITGSDSLVATIRSYRPGDKVTVTYLRGGETKTAELTLDSDASTSNS